MKARIVSLAVVAAAALGGCATSPMKPSNMTYTRTYSDSRTTMWRRILTASAREAMFIRRADEAAGVIATDWEKPTSGQSYIFEESISNWAWCGSGGLLGRTLSQRAEVSYLVRSERDGRTTVIVNGRFQVLRAGLPMQAPQWVECTSTGALEEKLVQTLYYDQAT